MAVSGWVKYVDVLVCECTIEWGDAELGFDIRVCFTFCKGMASKGQASQKQIYFFLCNSLGR